MKFAASIWIFYNFQIKIRIVSTKSIRGNAVFLSEIFVHQTEYFLRKIWWILNLDLYFKIRLLISNSKVQNPSNSNLKVVKLGPAISNYIPSLIMRQNIFLSLICNFTKWSLIAAFDLFCIITCHKLLLLSIFDRPWALLEKEINNWEKDWTKSKWISTW